MGATAGSMGLAIFARVPSASGRRFRPSGGRTLRFGVRRSTSSVVPSRGDYDHGVFITTSRFTKEATEASYKKGAITILLLDGDAIAELMIERGIGVIRQPLYLYEIDAAFFEFDESDE